MHGRQKINKYTLSLLLITFILSIDFADAKNGKWKPGNENYRRFPIDRTSQNDGRIPPGKTIQNDSIIQINGKMQTDRRIPIDRTLQNDRIIPTGKTIQNDRRIPIDRKLQNARIIPTGKTIQNDRRMHIDRNMKNDRIMQYNKRVHGARTYRTDGIMQEDSRIRINRILENDRLSENELQRKIDSLTQNKNMQNDLRVPDGRRMLNERMQNDSPTLNHLKVQNTTSLTTRILDERNQNMINARSSRYDNIMRAATPHRVAQQPLRDGAAADTATKSEPQVVPVPSDEIIAAASANEWGDFMKNTMKAIAKVKALELKDTPSLTTRACHIIATTYISAFSDYKRYYTLRYFYANNLEYEVGYVVSEIISKYQRMLELYDLATEYFYKHQDKRYAVSNYVLYIYTNVLEMGTVISHLCNMLNELENKYKLLPIDKSGFQDYHFAKHMQREEMGAARDKSITDMMAAYRLAYAKALARKKRAQAKQRKKKRAKDLNINSVVTTPLRKPKSYGHWPLTYGWSIEFL